MFWSFLFELEQVNADWVSYWYPHDMFNQLTEAAIRGVLCKKVFLEIRKIHRETPVSESFFFL